MPAILVLCLLSGQLQASDGKSPESFRLAADFRYRAEAVDQEGFDRNALASTLRSRLTLTVTPTAAWSWVMEVDDVRALGADRYNSTSNGGIRYPVVADPEGTDLNRAALAWRRRDITLRAGRQRIGHGSERFIGGVAWRQNEQTYDGLRLRWEPADSWSVDASYVATVRRIFGPDNGAQPASWDGDSLFLRGEWQPAAGLTLRPFAYRVDVEPDAGFGPAVTVDNSSDTAGVGADWSAGPLTLEVAYARQWDQGASTLDYAADYYLARGTYEYRGIRLQLSREVLGADNGSGFRTPLATLHKFQGWADVFLTTPPSGIEDTSLALEGGTQALSWRLVAHRFRAEQGSQAYGREFDLNVHWQLNKRLSLQLRFADFDGNGAGDEAFGDVRKAWFIARLALP